MGIPAYTKASFMGGPLVQLYRFLPWLTVLLYHLEKPSNFLKGGFASYTDDLRCTINLSPEHSNKVETALSLEFDRPTYLGLTYSLSSIK